MRHAIAVLFLFSVCAVGQDAKTDPKGIVFPSGPVNPVPPQPPPNPQNVVKLTPDIIYLIHSDKAYLVTSSPRGIVKITQESGPLRVRGYFWDGNGQVETRTFESKYLWFVEPVANGTCEIIAFPPGATGENELQRRMVEASVSPRPPPKPPEPPTPPDPPKPPPSPAPIPAPGLRVLIVEETAKRTKEVHAIIFNPELRAYLKKACVTDADNPNGAWKMWDKDLDVSAEIKLWRDALARPRTAVPWILISNGVTGYEGPLPANVAETTALIQKYEVK